MARLGFRSGLERDIYHIITKLETTNNSTLNTIPAVYDAIKRSNSSLGRLKKRPLEDAIDRVLQIRKQEESDDSEAAIDNVQQTESGDSGFLLNRQMTKHWKLESSQPSATKRRRSQTDHDKDPDSALAGAPGSAHAQRGKSPQADATQDKKKLKLSRHCVEQLDELLPMGGFDEIFHNVLQHCFRELKSTTALKLFERGELQKCPGVLISGPSGVGKKTLIKNIAAKLRVPLIYLTPCLLVSDKVEKAISEAFDTALSLAPSIILLENIEECLPKTGSSSHSDQHTQEARYYFKKQMARLSSSGKQGRVLAIATTSKFTDVDPTLLGINLFRKTYQLRIPDNAARLGILQALTARKKLANDVDLSHVAALTHGYVASDLASIIVNAQDSALDRVIARDEAPDESPAHADCLAENTEALDMREPITRDDLTGAIRDYIPSLRKEGFTAIPSVTWDQVGALEDVRRQLQSSIVGPIHQSELYSEWDLTQPAGVVLWGPPGCGKTLVAQAVANEAQASFIVINGPELLNKYVGETERAVREVFQRARLSAPCILFFDEFDSVAAPRGSTSTDSGARIVNTLLTELDGSQGRTGVYVIATTNRPDLIDSALLRPGRLSVQLLIDMPTPTERVKILRAIHRKFLCAAAPKRRTDTVEVVDSVALDPRCEGFTGADLRGLHTKACQHGLERCEKAKAAETDTPQTLTQEDWEYALSNTRASVKDPELYRVRGNL